MKKRPNKTSTSFFTARSISPVIRVLAMADVVIFGAFGLITPIFAIFVIGSIEGGTIAVAGLAQAIYLLSKSFFQIPFALKIDRKKGEVDDFWYMFSGYVVFSLVPLAYILVDSVLGLLLMQFIYGVSHAALSPAWSAIWIRHIDKGHEGIESGTYNSMMGLGMAFTASIGGFLAEEYGFNALFVVVSLLALMGTFSLLIARKNMEN